MELTKAVEPEKVRKWAEEIVVISPPSKIKIQTTGPGAQTILDESPPEGMTWSVFIRVEAAETEQ